MNPLTRLLTRTCHTFAASSTCNPNSKLSSIYPLTRLLTRTCHTLDSYNPKKIREYAKTILEFKEFNNHVPFRSDCGTYGSFRSNCGRYDWVFDQLYPLQFSDPYAEKEDPKLTMFNWSLYRSLKSGNTYDHAEKLFRESPVLNAASYAIMIKGLCIMRTKKKEALKKAISYLDEMDERGFKIEIATYHNILNELYYMKMFSDWEMIWQRTENDGFIHGLDSYICRMEVLIKEGNISKAHDLLEKVKFLFTKLKCDELKPDDFCYNVLIKAYIDSDKLEDAKIVYNDMLESGCKGDSFTYMKIVPMLCEKGDFYFASQIIRNYMHPHFGYDEMVQTVVKGLAKHSNVDEAIDFAEFAHSKGCYGLRVPKKRERSLL